MYDCLSSFSNHGMRAESLFSELMKSRVYKEVGVYDPQDIQKKINEQCLQMEPIVRPLLTVVQKRWKGICFS